MQLKYVRTNFVRRAFCPDSVHAEIQLTSETAAKRGVERRNAISRL
jgi:hypothetical protein